MRDDLRPVPFRGGGFAPKHLRFFGPATFLAVLAYWWVGTRLGWISPIAMPTPMEVARALIDMVQTGELWQHLGASLQRLLIGGAIGGISGVIVGFAIGALLPLFIIWFGIGESSKYATIAFGVFSPMVIAAFGGVDGVDRNLIRMAQSFGLPTRDIIAKIVLPGALPALLSGIRIAASIGIILLTAAEMIGAQYGVGAMVLASGNLMQTDRLIAGVLILSALGLTVAFLIGCVEKTVLKWRG